MASNKETKGRKDKMAAVKIKGHKAWWERINEMYKSYINSQKKSLLNVQTEEMIFLLVVTGRCHH